MPDPVNTASFDGMHGSASIGLPQLVAHAYERTWSWFVPCYHGLRYAPAGHFCCWLRLLKKSARERICGVCF